MAFENRERLIFHVDVNSAFLSWTSVQRLEQGESDLRLIPAIIGGDPENRTSVVLAKSIPAKRYGIVTGEPVSLAIRKCPELVIARSDFSLYKEKSKLFKDICRQYAPVVESFSIDECFLDMTGTGLIYPDPIKTAHEIREKIRDELGFTVNIGIGPNKLLAKMAGDFEKPDKVHTLFRNEIPGKMWPLPCSDLLFCGKASADKLSANKIKTIGDLANADLKVVQRILGKKLGSMLFAYANGLDDSPVSAEPEEAKGYSNEETFEEDIVTTEDGHKVLRYLADKTGARVRKAGVRAYCISVTIRGNDMKKHSHQKNLYNATDITAEIYETAEKLFDELWDGRMPIRLIGLSLTGLETSEVEQISMFDTERLEKERKMDRAADIIRGKFGKGVLKRGFHDVAAMRERQKGRE